MLRLAGLYVLEDLLVESLVFLLKALKLTARRGKVFRLFVDGPVEVPESLLGLGLLQRVEFLSVFLKPVERLSDFLTFGLAGLRKLKDMGREHTDAFLRGGHLAVHLLHLRGAP